jgi:endonuclease/exonuclease/phosphatase (EEP) superfamily protein YafD
MLEAAMRILRIVLVALFAPPLALVTALCATAALAAWLGQSSLRWDVLAHFAPLWLAGSALGLAVGVFLKGFDRVLLAGLGLMGVLAAGGLIAPELVRGTGPKAPANAAGQLKVVQFNTWYRNRETDRIVAWLAKEDPDIAVLEETNAPLRHAVIATGRWRVDCDSCEVMILSKRPPIETGAPKVATAADGPLNRATFRDARGVFTVIGVHYTWPTDPLRQQPQEQRLLDTIAKFPRGRTIVAGDFNSAPWSFARRRWDRLFALPRRDRALFSFPSPVSDHFHWLGRVQFLAIDHVYAGPDWATVSVKRGPALGSDHRPVVVTLAPAARP